MEKKRENLVWNWEKIMKVGEHWTRELIKKEKVKVQGRHACKTKSEKNLKVKDKKFQ